VGLLETFGRISLILEPGAYVLVDQLARVQSEVSVLYHHVSDTVIEIGDLWNLSRVKQLSEMFYFRAYRIVVISERM
jgi:hypothetical protein